MKSQFFTAVDSTHLVSSLIDTWIDGRRVLSQIAIEHCSGFGMEDDEEHDDIFRCAASKRHDMKMLLERSDVVMLVFNPWSRESFAWFQDEVIHDVREPGRKRSLARQVENLFDDLNEKMDVKISFSSRSASFSSHGTKSLPSSRRPSTMPPSPTRSQFDTEDLMHLPVAIIEAGCEQLYEHGGTLPRVVRKDEAMQLANKFDRQSTYIELAPGYEPLVRQMYDALLHKAIRQIRENRLHARLRELEEIERSRQKDRCCSWFSKVALGRVVHGLNSLFAARISESEPSEPIVPATTERRRSKAQAQFADLEDIVEVDEIVRPYVPRSRGTTGWMQEFEYLDRSSTESGDPIYEQPQPFDYIQVPNSGIFGSSVRDYFAQNARGFEQNTRVTIVDVPIREEDEAVSPTNVSFSRVPDLWKRRESRKASQAS